MNLKLKKKVLNIKSLVKYGTSNLSLCYFSFSMENNNNVNNNNNNNVIVSTVENTIIGNMAHVNNDIDNSTKKKDKDYGDKYLTKYSNNNIYLDEDENENDHFSFAKDKLEEKFMEFLKNEKKFNDTEIEKMKNIHYQLDAFYIRNNKSNIENFFRIEKEFIDIIYNFENIADDFFEKNKYFMVSKDYNSIYDKNVNDIKLYGKKIKEYKKNVISTYYNNKDNSMIGNKRNRGSNKNDNKSENKNDNKK